MKPLKAGSDYVTVRQSLSILSTILLDRQFMDAMVQFVAKEEYLKAILILLGNSSKVVQFEAFHIFKIFAANPNKTLKITKLLVQNYERIVKLLDHIEQDRAEDSEFRQDKNAVVAKLQSLTERSKNDAVASKKPPIQGNDSLRHEYQVS
jgi:calcium binding protein 39